MKRALLLPFFIWTIFSSMSISACPGVSAWQEHSRTDPYGNSFSLYSYRRWPSYLPGFYLDPQVVVLNGGNGGVDCTNSVMYNAIGSKASYYWRQAITLDLNYWANGRNTIQQAASYVVATLNKLVNEGYLRPSFYLIGGSAGSAVISAALDYHPSFMNRVERAIFVSGPFTDITRTDVTNGNAVAQLMDINGITRLDSLNISMPYDPTRYNRWIKPIMDKKGLRFFVAEDDNVFCEPSSCSAGTMYEEFLNWVSIATDDTENRASLENLGILWVYPQGGHDLFNTHPELLNDAFVP
ncbi:MAG: hypothetical protein ABW098_12820 [Candidatus Thiodiazotropha sp.]